MGRLDNRVAVVTGAGRGLGREHALFLAAQGAAVVVNDLGASLEGEGSDRTPAEEVVDEITSAGGRAVVSTHDVSDWRQAAEMVELAVEVFGDLHVLVNNAGILRDRTLANMSEEEWDSVVRVQLKGHAAPTRHAMAYWRERAKGGQDVNASVIHTSSIAGFAGNFGQANYSAAKLAVVALSWVVMREGERYGVRSNAVSPGARTRLSTAVPDAESLAPPDDPNVFDRLDPANVSPLIGWLAEADCPANGQVFHLAGRHLMVLAGPHISTELVAPSRWTLDNLDELLPDALVRPPGVEDFIRRGPKG